MFFFTNSIFAQKKCIVKCSINPLLGNPRACASGNFVFTNSNEEQKNEGFKISMLVLPIKVEDSSKKSSLLQIREFFVFLYTDDALLLLGREKRK